MLRKLIFFIALAGGIAWGQAACIPGQALTSRQGFSNLAAVVPQATAQVSPGPIFTDQTGSIQAQNPAVADAFGNYQICATAGSTQTVTVSGPNMQVLTYKLTFPSQQPVGPSLTGANTFTGLNTFNGPTVFNNSVTMGAPTISWIKNNTTVNFTGDTTVHTVYTIPIPGGAMGPNNQLRITVVMSNLSNNGAAIRVLYGGTLITPPTTVGAALSNSTGVYVLVVGGNTGVTNSQSWDNLAINYQGTVGSGNQQHATSTVDSTATQNLTVTYQGNINSDNWTFYRCIVEIL